MPDSRPRAKPLLADGGNQGARRCDVFRRWLGLLMARGLVKLGVQGNTVLIGLTEKGRELSATFRADPLYADIAGRSDLITKTFGPLSATALKDFVYAAIPEITDMKWGEEITPDKVQGNLF